MKPIEELLRNLGRPGVLEFGLVTNRLPSVNIGGKFEPVDDEAPSTEALFKMLITMGGGRYVEQLSERPVQWTTRLEGVGVIAVAAIVRRDIVQARFTVARREEPALGVATAPMPAQPSEAPRDLRRGQQVPSPRPPLVASRPLRTSPATGGVPERNEGPPSSRRAGAAVEAPLKSPVAGPSLAAARTGAVPPPDAWDDDDEPTVQTLFPPVASAVGPGVEAKPRPARTSVGTAGNGPPRRAGKPSTTWPTTQEGPAEKERPRADGQLESLLELALAARASDLHVVAGRPLLLRVASELLPGAQTLLAEHVERMARTIVPARLRETLEAHGSCDFAMDGSVHGRFRVNVSRQRTGYKLSMRVVPREVPTLAALGLPAALGDAAKREQGLVLISGPQAHGKTTTLAAIVDILNRDTARHVLTVEDPVEFLHPRKRAFMSQREVGVHARSYASALEASMREDPDVVVVGELRDAETARLAIAAAEAGCLVLATMNTPSAAGTAPRVIEMFSTAEQPALRASLARVLRLIVGQRLVPSVDRTRLHAAVELLPSSMELYTSIRHARSILSPSLDPRGRAQGVVVLDESLAELVWTEKVALEVAKHFAESPRELEALVTRHAPTAAARED